MDAPAAVEIRPMTTDDIEASVDLFSAVADEGRWIAREPPIDRDDARRFLAGQLAASDRTLLVAIEPSKGALVGQIGLSEDLPGVVDLGMLVADGWRSRGVGSALLDAGTAWARGRGAHKMALQVWPHNERAIGLYEKFGFEREGVLRRHYRRRNGELWDAVLMARALD